MHHAQKDQRDLAPCNSWKINASMLLLIVINQQVGSDGGRYKAIKLVSVLVVTVLVRSHI